MIPTLDEADLRLPPKLRPGDRVGVIAPSLPLAVRYPQRFERGLAALARSLDVEVVVVDQCRQQTGFTAGDARTRADALCRLIADPDIRAIFCAIGGFNSAEILPFLDPGLVRANPKAMVGYSDVTALLLGLQALGGWITYHGPAVMPQLGEYPEPLDYTARSLKSLLTGDGTAGEIGDPEGWTDEFLDWGTEAWLERPRRMNTPAGREIWREGHGTGRLFGGNVETLNLLIGTPYFRPPGEIVLFWEANAEEAYLPRVRRALTQLQQTGLLSRTRALLVGRSPDALPVSGSTLREVVVEAVADFEFPVIGELAFGHTDPMMTLPVGARFDVQAESGSARLSILGP